MPGHDGISGLGRSPRWVSGSVRTSGLAPQGTRAHRTDAKVPQRRERARRGPWRELRACERTTCAQRYDGRPGAAVSPPGCVGCARPLRSYEGAKADNADPFVRHNDRHDALGKSQRRQPLAPMQEREDVGSEQRDDDDEEEAFRRAFNPIANAENAEIIPAPKVCIVLYCIVWYSIVLYCLV